MKRKYWLFCLTLLFSSIGYSQIGYRSDSPPTNFGGKTEFKRIFEQEIIYPEALLKQKIGGQVSITCTIKKDSSVKNVVVNKIGIPELEDEAQRLFNLLVWVPAFAGNYPIETSHSVLYDFDPEKYSKICKKRGYATISYLTNSVIDSSGKIYNSGVQMPIYEKGNFALQDFIKKELEYPRQAQLGDIQGTVVLSFIVEPSGLVTNIGVKQDIGGGCEEEAIRILQKIKWYPGKRDDEKLIRVKMNYPFYFILNEDFKDNAAGEQK